MQNFENIEDLVSHMFENLDGDDPVSVVADKNLAVAVMKELLDYEDVILDLAEVDDNYDKEYLVSLYDDTDTNYWHVSIEQIYNYEKDNYFSTDGYVLFHEDVNSKALVDMQNNEFIELSGYDWFVIGDDDETDDTDETETESGNNIPTVNGRRVNVDEYNAFVSKFAPYMMIKTDDNPSNASKIEYKINGINATKEEYEKALSKFDDRYLDNIRDMLLRYAEFMDEMNEWRKLLRW